MSKDEQALEALSALIDGELPTDEADRLLDAMSEDPELREHWRRHHQISGLLSGHSELVGDGGALARRIHEALDDEPVSLIPRRRVAATGWSAGRRLALVAGLALVAVVVALGLGGDRAPVSGARQVAEVTPDVSSTPVPEPVAVAARANAPAPATRTQLTWNDARPGVEARLNGYLLNHNEYLSDGVRGMLPYARVVGYEPRN